MTKLCYALPEIEELTGISISTLRNDYMRGTLRITKPSLKKKGKVYVTHADLESYLNRGRVK